MKRESAPAPGCEVESGLAVWIPGAHEAEQKQFIEEVLASVVGRKFAEKYGSPFDENHNLPLIAEAVGKLYIKRGIRLEYMTSGIFIDAMKTVMDVEKDKLILLTTEEETPAPTVEQEPLPTDKNGKPLSASQLAWREHAEFACTASSRQIAERKRTDASFRAFVEDSLRREMQQPIDGDVREANPHLSLQKPTGKVTPALLEFAEGYRKMSTSEIRSKRSAAINPNGYESFKNANGLVFA